MDHRRGAHARLHERRVAPPHAGTGTTWFFSRSRDEYWNKGATSGHFQNVHELRYDCDGDTLLALVEQTGAACHTGDFTCFDGRWLSSPTGERPPFLVSHENSRRP